MRLTIHPKTQHEYGTFIGLTTFYIASVCVASFMFIPSEDSALNGILESLVWPLAIIVKILH